MSMYKKLYILFAILTTMLISAACFDGIPFPEPQEQVQTVYDCATNTVTTEAIYENDGVTKVKNAYAINWQSQEETEGYVVYGILNDLSNISEDKHQSTSHTYELTGLQEDTEYNFSIQGNLISDPTVTFDCKDYTFLTEFYIYNATVNNSNDSDYSTATVVWTTIPQTTSKVQYGITADNLSTEIINKDGNGNELYVTSHSIALSSLLPNTKYYYKVSSVSATGNIASSVIQEFTTGNDDSPCLDTTPPSDIAATPTPGDYENSLTVALSSNDNSGTYKIYYTTDGSEPTTASPQYTSQISLNNSITIQAVAVDACNNKSNIKALSYVIGTVEPPTATPDSGLYSSNLAITLNATSGNTIYYTTNGATPTVNSPVYTDPINITKDTVIKAIAQNPLVGISTVATFIYVLDKVPPTAPISTKPSGTYTSTSFDIELSSIDVVTPNPKIYYTTDASMPTTSSTLYTGPITITGDKTIKAIAVDNAGNISFVSEYIYSIDIGAVNPPTATPNSGMYNSDKSITLTADANTNIYFTTNGSTPTISSTQYTVPFIISITQTLKAIAVSTITSAVSTVASYNYIIDKIAPTDPEPNLPAGTYNSTQTITLTATDNLSLLGIKYTLDGSTPNIASTLYTGAITVSSNTIIKAIAYDAVGNASNVVTFTYIIDASSVNPPLASPIEGLYASAVSVQLLGDSGVTIYFTTDGSTPTTSSSQYTSPLNVAVSKTIKAIAVNQAGTLSTVQSFDYVIDMVPPSTPTANIPSGLYGETQVVTLSSSDLVALQGIYYTLDGTTPTASSAIFSGSITICSDTTLKAVAIDKAGNMSSVATFTYQIDNVPPSVPTSSLVTGTYPVAQSVTLSAVDNVAISKIYYTTNGTDPTLASTEYTVAIDITTTTNLKAIAVDTMGNISPIGSWTYTIDTQDPNAPTASPVAGTYTSAQTVTLSATDPGNPTNPVIYFTTNGDTPTTASAVYTVGINVSINTTIKAIAVDAGGRSSTVATFAYVFDTTPPAVPVASPVAGLYKTVQNVTLTSSDDSGSYTIYYTLDGVTVPDKTSTEYTGAINVAASTVIKAIAYDAVNNHSVDVTFTYTIDTAAPFNLTASVPSNSYKTAQSVSLSAQDNITLPANIKFYYTTNGDTPTTSSTLYSSAINIAVTSTLKFIAVDEAGNISTTAQYNYIIDTTNPSAPTATPDSGTYSTAQDIQLNATDDNGTVYIYYTTTSDGSTPADPDTGSTLFNAGSPINVPANTNVKIKARSYDAAGNYSTISSFDYVVDTSAVNPPTASPVAGLYNAAQNVTLNYDGTCSGCKIYFTTDGVTNPTTASTEYTAQIPVNSTTTIKAIAVDDSVPTAKQSTIATFVYTIDTTNPLTPTASPSTGVYKEDQSVSLFSSDNSGSYTIYYTTTGVDPTSGSTQYTGTPFTVAVNVAPVVVKAIAYDPAGNYSTIGSFTYTFDTTAPTVGTPAPDPASGPFGSVQSITLTATDDIDPSPTIYYTTDGVTDPTTASTEFTGSFNISNDTQIRVIAKDDAGNISGVSTFNYVVDTTNPANPTANIPTGSYNAAQTISLSSSDDHGSYTIYYTTDGVTDPTTGSTEYTGSFNVSTTTTVKARAYDAAGNYSGISTFTYTIDTTLPDTPTANPTTGLSNSPISVTLSCTDGTATIYFTTNGSTPTSGSTQYSSAISIDTTGSGTVTLKAIAIDPAGNQCLTVGSWTYTLDRTLPATPTATDPAGTYTTDKSITLSSSDANGIAAIYYTTDGSDPTSSGTRVTYSAAINVTADVTIKAAALDNAGNYSAIGTYAYIIDKVLPSVPTASPAGGIYNTAKSVTLSATDDRAGVVIRYTTDNSTPNASSPIYGSAINVNSNMTIKAMSFDVAGNSSGEAVFNYVIDTIGPNTPAASPAGGTFASSQTVTLTATDPNGPLPTIYYTTNGDTPTSGSTEYTGSFTVSSTSTIKAIAIDQALNQSAVGSWDFTISAGDTTPPAITSGPSETNVTPISADIIWTTDELATSQIEYSTTPGFTAGTGTLVPATDPDGANNLSHSVSLSGLTESTIYYYRVVTKDASNNTTTTSVYSFVTGAAADVTAPVISSVTNTTPDCSSVNISWSTDELATTQVEYSTTNGFATGSGTRVPATDPDGANNTVHSYSLTGLTVNTVYYYKVISKDASGNMAVSTQGTFTTAVSCDTLAPNIGDVFVSGISDVSATVNWTTDEVATSQVEYSTNPSFTLGTGTRVPATDPDGANKTSHTVTLTGLSASTTYYFKVISKDGNNNQAVSATYSFTTASSSSDGWQSVIPPTVCSGSFGITRNTADVFKGELFFAGKGSGGKADMSKSDYTQTNVTCSGVGLGNSSFTEVIAAATATFDGTQYIYFGSTGSQGAGLSRSVDGASFSDLASGGGSACDSSGFGESDNKKFTAMYGGNGYLYAGTLNTNTGAFLYIANDDSNHGTACDFSTGSGNGYIFDGATSETQISSIAVYGAYVYIGVKNASGAKIYRATHNPSAAAPWTWTDVTPTFDVSETITDISAMTVYNGKLWFGTENAAGAELYSYDGSSYTKVFDFSGTDASNKKISAIEPNNVSYLYFGTSKAAGSGAEIWRSTDAGTTFSQTGADGLGNTNMNSVTAMSSTGDTIYFTMNNETSGATAIYRKQD